MSNRVDIKLQGDKELIAFLERIGQIGEQYLAQGAVDGGKLLEHHMESDAPGPFIASGISKQGPGFVEVVIGPDKEHWYYVFTEFGASPHEMPDPKRRGLKVLHGPDGEKYSVWLKHPGMIAAPFIRPTLDTKQTAAYEAVAAPIRRAIEQEAARQPK